MSDEVSMLPMALSEVEREIATVDSEAERLTAKVTKLAVKKRSLLKTRRGLEELLGKTEPEPFPVNTEPFNEVAVTSSEFPIPRNAFRYLGPARAARKLLRKVGHRLTHAELVEMLLRGNVKSKARFPSDSFRAAIHRRPDWFVWKKEIGEFGYWELVEWQEAENEPKVNDSVLPFVPKSLSLVGA
jgi:hypothetical protein